MSPVFPRTIASRITTAPVMPEGGAQWGLAGKGQFRAFDNTGRVWQEIYSAFGLLNANGRTLMMEINRAQREKIIWDIQHPHYTANYGVLGGTPLVDGAAQTGSTLNIKGGPLSTTDWLKAGDIIQIAGLQLVYDIVADVNTDGTGDAAATIHPPIFAGGSPANSAAITIDSTSIFFKAVLIGVEMPDIEAHGVLAPGLTLTWREQPS